MSIFNRRLEVRAFKQASWGGMVQFHFRQVTARDGIVENIAYAQPLEMKVLPDGIEGPPAFSLEPEDAQKFMDELWDCGLRPTEGVGSAGAMAAVQRHLEDMRQLVFKGKTNK